MPSSLRRLTSISKTLLSSRPIASSFSPLIRRTMSSSAAPPVLKKPVKLACIQLATGNDKDANIQHAAAQVAKAAGTGAKIVVLPECFNSPYGTQYFPKHAETLLPSPPSREQSPTYHALADMAASNGVYLVGGSIPEFNPATGKHHNTALIFGPDGKLLASHRKTHLFDIDIPGKITFKESDVLSPGNKVTLVDLPEYGTIAVAICYDVRFPELAQIAARKGAFVLIYPGAFNTTTGPLHWHLLSRARAVDNQLYVAMCSPARESTFPAYGHSLIVDPLAEVVAETGENESMIEWELDGDKIAEVRRNIPVISQRRFDVYPDVSQGKVNFTDPELEDIQ